MRSFIPRAGISLVLGLSLSLNLGLAGAQTKDKVPAKEADSSADQGVGRARQLHPLPQSVAGNSTVTLHCGRQYYGTLDLSNRSNVTVRTEGSCGKASISPGQPVKGWGRQKGTIWIAPVASPPDIVTWNDKPLALAHFPNKPWAKGRSDSPSRIHAKLPSADLAGATVVYRPEEWMIETRKVLDYDNGAIVLGPKVGDAFDPKPETEFYVEGKLWMLDAPGEWAWQDGWLYLSTPDGQSPEGRVWAAPRANAVNAEHSRNITIENVRLHTATIGINAGDSANLHVRNVEISNLAQDGIFVGGSGLLVDSVKISNAVQNGILGYYGIREVAVINSTIENTGMVGMPKRSKGGITFEQSSAVRVQNNSVLNSSYIGIRVHKDAVVSNNIVDGACLRLSDCGGIYTFAPDKQALNVRIEGNTVRNLSGRYAYAVYLDDSANGVTVARNLLTKNPGALEIHNGYNNVITQNVFADSGYEQVLFNETGNDRVSRNRFSKNVFIGSGKVPNYRLWSNQDGKTNAQFAEYDDNLYVGSGENFAELQGTGIVNWSSWRRRLSQDVRSRLETNQDAGRAEARKWPAGAVQGKSGQ
jgi:hypothetical protein